MASTPEVQQAPQRDVVTPAISSAIEAAQLQKDIEMKDSSVNLQTSQAELNRSNAANVDADTKIKLATPPKIVQETQTSATQAAVNTQQVQNLQADLQRTGAQIAQLQAETTRLNDLTPLLVRAQNLINQLNALKVPPAKLQADVAQKASEVISNAPNAWTTQLGEWIGGKMADFRDWITTKPGEGWRSRSH